MADPTSTTRDAWLLATDEQLLAQCQEHRYRASGPGGQHRNKTESAIRLVHQPTGITVTATERRSQHENRAKAIERLREAIAVHVRCLLQITHASASEPSSGAAKGAFQPESLRPSLARNPFSGAVRGARLVIGRRDPQYLVLLAWALDAIAALSGRISDAANLFGLSTSQLVALLKDEPKRLVAANTIRAQSGLEPLR